MSSDLFVVDQEPYHLLHTQNTPPPPPLPSMMNMYDDNSETQFLYYPFSSDIDTVLLDHDIEPPPPTPQMIPISTSTQTTTTVQLSSCSIDESSNHASTTFISNSNSSNSNSPPSIQLETLSLRQQHDQHFHFTNQLPNTSSDFPHQFTTGDYSQSHEKRKTEETPLQILGFDSPNFNTCGSTSNNRNSNNPTSWFLHLENGGVDSVCSYGEEKIRQSSSSSNNAAIMKYLQRSFSYGHYSNYINEVDHEHGSSSSLFQTNFINPILESGIQIEGSSLTDTNTKGFDQVSGQIRRVFSTGDLVQVAADQNTKCINGQKTAVATVCSSSLRNDGMMSSYIEEGGGNFKVGKYSAEERRERIDRYRAKRSQRNFNKTIKYACRKTLADNRPRIRGRFARNDETGDVVISKPNSSSSYLNNTYGYGYDQDEDDHLWQVDGLHREVEEEEEEEKRVIDGCIGGDGGGDGRNRRMMFETQSDHQHQQKLYNYQYYNNCGC